MTLRTLCLMLAVAASATPVSARADGADAAKPDAEMAAASAQSVAALPAFDAALARNFDAILEVRIPCGADCIDRTWLGPVRRNADGSYEGIVRDRVAHQPDMRPGTFYHARRDQVVDWVYHDDKGDHGGYTVRLLRKRGNGFLDVFHFVD